MLKYLADNRYFLLFCLTISTVAFGFALTTVAFSIDEETASVIRDPMLVWLRMDRWGMYLLQHLMPLHPPIPYVSMGLGMVFNLASILLCLSIWSFRSGVAKYLAAVFALTHPINAFIYQFNQSQYGYYLGLLLAIAGVYYFIKYSGVQSRLTIPLILWVLSLSLYQSMIFAAPTVYFIYLLQQRIHGQYIDWKKILFFGAILLLAVVLHEGIAGLIRQQSGAVDRYHTIASFYGGDVLRNVKPIFILKEMTAQLIGHRWYVGYATGAVLLLSLGYILKNLISGEQPYHAVALVIAAICAPFLFVILTSRIWPARTMMALPFMYAGFVYIAQVHWPNSLNRWVIILTVICFLSYTASNTRLFYADYITWQNDKLLANRLTSAIEKKYGDQIGENRFPMVIVGVPALSDLPIAIHEETFGGSIFRWDDGNQQRIQSLFQIIGVEYFKQPTRSQIATGEKLAKNLPNWPASASILFEQGLFVVKLSE